MNQTVYIGNTLKWTSNDFQPAETCCLGKQINNNSSWSRLLDMRETSKTSEAPLYNARRGGGGLLAGNRRNLWYTSSMRERQLISNSDNGILRNLDLRNRGTIASIAKISCVYNALYNFKKLDAFCGWIIRYVRFWYLLIIVTVSLRFVNQMLYLRVQ